MAEFCVCFWKSDHLRLVKMVLSIVFVFLSAEDFPIFLFSKINRSLSNIFKSMNRLLSLPTKIQIKNTKNHSKDADFQSKMTFSTKMYHFNVFSSKPSNFLNGIWIVHFRWTSSVLKKCHFRWNFRHLACFPCGDKLESIRIIYFVGGCLIGYFLLFIKGFPFSIFQN